MTSDAWRQAQTGTSQLFSEGQASAAFLLVSPQNLTFLAFNKLVGSTPPSFTALDLAQACENCSPVCTITK